MIYSKDDFKQYVLADMKSLGMEYPSIKLRVKTLLSPPRGYGSFNLCFVNASTNGTVDARIYGKRLFLN